MSALPYQKKREKIYKEKKREKKERSVLLSKTFAITQAHGQHTLVVCSLALVIT
jgi:hypothetical protein